MAARWRPTPASAGVASSNEKKEKHAMGAQGSDQSDPHPLSNLAPELAAAFVSVASEIALVLNDKGVIEHVACGVSELLDPPDGTWIGRPWIETVSLDSRGKIMQMLLEAAGGVSTVRRQVNHSRPGGPDIPIAYAALRLGPGGPVVAVGRDLRAVAAIQQRLVSSQQELERSYWKRRQEEARYRLLFQVATDAVLILDAETLKITEANPAAVQLFDFPIEALSTTSMPSLFHASSRPAVEDLLANARASGRPAEIRARLSNRTASLCLSASPLRTDESMLLLVRARDLPEDARDAASAASLSDLVARTPDGVVVTDSAGCILVANQAFASMCELGDASQLVGTLLGCWIEQTGADLASIIEFVRQHGIAQQLGLTLRSCTSQGDLIEVSAVVLDEGEQERLGFTVRRLALRAQAGLSRCDELSDSIRAMTGRLGSDDLNRLTKDAAQLAQSYFIAAALDRAHGELDVAAKLLGVARSKLQLLIARHRSDPGDGSKPKSH